MSNRDGSVRVDHRQDGWVVTLQLTAEGMAKLQRGGRVQVFDSEAESFAHHSPGNRSTVKEVVCELSS